MTNKWFLCGQNFNLGVCQGCGWGWGSIRWIDQLSVSSTSPCKPPQQCLRHPYRHCPLLHPLLLPMTHPLNIHWHTYWTSTDTPTDTPILLLIIIINVSFQPNHMLQLLPHPLTRPLPHPLTRPLVHPLTLHRTAADRTWSNRNSPTDPHSNKRTNAYQLQIPPPP